VNELAKQTRGLAFPKQTRGLAFPKQTLCQITFANGEDTNDFIPDEVLKDDTISNADWWNEKNKDRYISLIEGEFKAISATPIQEH